MDQQRRVVVGRVSVEFGGGDRLTFRKNSSTASCRSVSAMGGMRASASSRLGLTICRNSPQVGGSMSSGNAAHHWAYSATVISTESDAVGATSVLSLQAAKVNRMTDSATRVKRLCISGLAHDGVSSCLGSSAEFNYQKHPAIMGRSQTPSGALISIPMTSAPSTST